MMQCIQFNGYGSPDVIELTTRPIPTCSDDAVLIAVHTAGVNGPDVMQRRGLYKPPAGVTDIPGLEVSGTVHAVGKNVTQFRVGDAVCALVAGGGYAEFVSAPQQNVLPIPAGLSLLEAGVLLETLMTVWSHLFVHAGFTAGHSILIHGGTSGIGCTATQLCKAFAASQILTTVSSAAHQQASLALGADVAIDYKQQDFVAEVNAQTQQKGVDFILDIIAGEYVQRNYAAAALNGTIVQIGVQQGAAQNVDFFPMLAKRLKHMGATLRSQSTAAKAELMASLQQLVWPFIAKGQIKPVIYKTFALQDARQAHELLTQGQHVGKIALVIQPKI